MHSISFSFFSMLFSNYILKYIKLYIKNIHIYIFFKNMYSKCMHIININYKYRDSFIIFYIYIY